MAHHARGDKSAQTHPPTKDYETAPNVEDQTASMRGSVCHPGGLDFLGKPAAAEELGRLAHYRVLKELGRGGMGCVLLAEDTILQRQVALKVMLPHFAQDAKAKERFLREARAAAKIHHDNIITIFQVHEWNNVPFIALEFLEGAPLDKYLKDKGSLPLPIAIRIAREMAEGLWAAHKEGLVHRDIKPGNVWLEAPKGRVKILDFGLARAELDDTHLTQSGAIIGTPAFMSPEQARGEKVDGRSDLFSLGVVLYRLTTGKQPFAGPTTIAMLTAIAIDTPRPARSLNAKIPESLEKIMVKLLEKDVARRYASAKELIADLNGVLKELTLAPRVDAPMEAFSPATSLTAAMAAPTPAPTPARRQSGPTAKARDAKRRPMLLAAVALGFCAISIVAWQIIIRIQNRDGSETKVEVKEAKNLIVEKDGKKVAEVPLEPKKIVDSNPGQQDMNSAFVRMVAALPVSKQADAVAAELKKLNPGFEGENGEFQSRIENGAVVEFSFVTQAVSDISPIRALPALQKLNCSGRHQTQGRARFMDLSPLKDMKLKELTFYNTSVNDLKPLRGMPLSVLRCPLTPVRDLAPLQGMKLQELDCLWTLVDDLTPLMGMPLLRVNLGHTFVSDLAPLEGMALEFLDIRRTHVESLSPLKSAPLAHLDCGLTAVADLSPLKRAWLNQLDITATRIADLAPLKGMPLRSLNCSESRVFDLAPLQGMPLETLNCSGAPIRDLTPVMRMSLNTLAVDATAVADLSSLRELTLKSVVCSISGHDELIVLRTLRTLETINNESAAAFWKRQDTDPKAHASFLTQVAGVPAEKQVEAVAQRLKDLNPGFDGKVTSRIIAGKVVELAFSSNSVTDVSPVQVLTTLEKLNCDGGWRKNGQLRDLTPLRGLRLKELAIRHTQVFDLAPLKDMPLEALFCEFSSVWNLAPLHGLPLANLNCWETDVRDLTPLKGMPLKTLALYSNELRDLTPLKELPLREIKCLIRSQHDVKVLQSIPSLTRLNDRLATEELKAAGDLPP